MYDEFKKDDEMWRLGRDRELARIREASCKTEYEEKGYTKGEATGFVKGQKIGTLQEKMGNCIKLIMNRYQLDAGEWLDTLNKRQLEAIFELIFEIADFDLLKQRIKTLK